MMASGDALEGHRPALLASTAVFAGLFCWAAWELPSRPGSLPGLLLAGLGVAHLAALAVLLSRPHQLRRVWRALSWLSLGAGAVLLGMIAVTAREMVQRFGNLGVAVALLLGVIGLLVLLATAPFALWGLRATGSARGSG